MSYLKPFPFLIALVSVLGCSDAIDEADANAAGSGKADDVVDTDGELFTTLPVLVDPVIVFHPAPALAAVQPTATLDFRYASCAARFWTVQREAVTLLEGPRVLLRVIDDGFDCFGPTVERHYSIQVTSDALAEQDFVLLNPSKLAVYFQEENAQE
jgi:hypothetical protein